MNLLQLPDELLLKILSSSPDAKTFGRCRKTCRKLNRIADSLDAWADEKWGGAYLVDNDPTFVRLLDIPGSSSCMISVTAENQVGASFMAVVSSSDKIGYMYLVRCEGPDGERIQLFEVEKKLFLKFEKMPRVATGKRLYYNVKIQ